MLPSILTSEYIVLFENLMFSHVVKIFSHCQKPVIKSHTEPVHTALSHTIPIRCTLILSPVYTSVS